MRNLKIAATAAGLALAGAALPAGAVQVTWYVTGHMEAAMPGTPADLMALAPAGAVFTASYSFDTASASSPIYFTSDVWRYVTSNGLGGATMDVAGNHIQSTAGISTIIEEASANGEQLTLNAGTVSGAAVPTHYDTVGLDVLAMGTSGPSTADPSVKWPWFSPFGGAKGAFQMVPSDAPPDLTKATYAATLNLFFYDSVTSGYYQRIGDIEAISTTPFTAAVPEPGAWALMLAGCAAIGLAVQRTRRAS